jgi:hypothetical protein
MTPRTKKNVQLSKRLRKWARTPRQCYWNAWRIAERLQGEGKPAVYVEGFVVIDTISFEHGWVELDGEIIDVTLPKDNYTYFAGLRFSDLQAAMWMSMEQNQRGLPMFFCFGGDGSSSLEFTRARLQAVLHAGLTGECVEHLRLAVELLSSPTADTTYPERRDGA